MKRFSIMITGGATIGGGIFSCLSGLIAQQSNDTLSALTASGGALALVGIVLYQAFKPVPSLNDKAPR